MGVGESGNAAAYRVCGWYGRIRFDDSDPCRVAEGNPLVWVW